MRKEDRVRGREGQGDGQGEGGRSGDSEGVREDEEVSRRGRRGVALPVPLCFPEEWSLVEVV